MTISQTPASAKRTSTSSSHSDTAIGVFTGRVPELNSAALFEYANQAPLLQHGAIDNATTQVAGRLAMSHEYQFPHTENPSDIKYADLDQSPLTCA
jgi:hypothetical protein